LSSFSERTGKIKNRSEKTINDDSACFLYTTQELNGYVDDVTRYIMMKKVKKT
jgi:hypothetical protein